MPSEPVAPDTESADSSPEAPPIPGRHRKAGVMRRLFKRPARTLATRRPSSPSDRVALLLLAVAVVVSTTAVMRRADRLAKRSGQGPVAGELRVEEPWLTQLRESAEAQAFRHVLVQLDYQPKYRDEGVWPDPWLPWGHVPEFTLFDNGTVVYLGRTNQVLTAHLDAAATSALVDQVRQLGVDGLSPTSTGNCAATTPCDENHHGLFTLIRVRREGVLKTLKVYDQDVNDPTAFFAVNDLLRDWTGPKPSSSGPVNNSIFTVYLAAVAAVPLKPHLSDFEAAEAPLPASIPLAFQAGWRDRLPAAWDAVILNALGAVMQIDVPEGYPGPSSVDDSARPTQTAPHYLAGLWTWRLTDPSGYSALGQSSASAADDGQGIFEGDERANTLIFVPWIYPDYDHRADLTKLVALRPQPDVGTVATEAPAPTPAPAVAVATLAPPAATWRERALTDERALGLMGPLPWLQGGPGIQTWEYWWNSESHGRIQQLKADGFTWFKQRLSWRDIEGVERGQYRWDLADYYVQAVRTGYGGPGQVLIQLAAPPDWAKASGEVPFDLEAWGDYVYTVADHFRGQVAAYEIMNEPNLAREWGGAPNPAAYAKVLREAYKAVKMADFQAAVVSAGLAPTGSRMPEAMGDVEFLAAMIDAMNDGVAGELDGIERRTGYRPAAVNLYYDALGVHAPGFKAPPETSPEQATATKALGGQPYFTFRRAETMKAAADAATGTSKQTVITEFGWTTDSRSGSDYRWMAVSRPERATFIQHALCYAYCWRRGPKNQAFNGPMFLFSARDQAWTPDNEAYWWSVTDEAGQLLPEIAEALRGYQGDWQWLESLGPDIGTERYR